MQSRQKKRGPGILETGLSPSTRATDDDQEMGCAEGIADERVTDEREEKDMDTHNPVGTRLKRTNRKKKRQKTMSVEDPKGLLGGQSSE